MLTGIMELFIDSASSSFIQVTVFVGAVLLFFGFVDYAMKGGLVRKIENSRKWQPVIGAFLGLTPGCGGAILVMPLYVKGTISFGTVVATLIATSGDSAFVMISRMPVHYLIIGFATFLVGVGTGYLVDYLKIGEKYVHHKKMKSPEELKAGHEKADHEKQHEICKSITECRMDHIRHIAHEEGDEIDMILHHQEPGELDPDSLNYKLIHRGFWVYWLIIAVGLVLGVMDLARMDIDNLIIPKFGLILGAVGTFASIGWLVLGKKFISDDTHEETEVKLMSLRETMIHNAEETAFVGAWVFFAYLLYNMVVFTAGKGNFEQGEALAQQMMMSSGIMAVIIGALIGLIPGCGPQIIFVTLYTRGWLPLAAVFANSISQDGDALLPLLAMDRKSALWATVINTIPALVFGIILYYIEVNTGLGNMLKFAMGIN